MMKKYLLSALVFLFLTIFIASCHTAFKSTKGDKPVVLVSIPPYISIVQAIAGDTVEVRSAINTSFDSHTSEITPRQAQMIQMCDLWIGVGEPYEKKLLTSLREAKKEVRVLQLNENTTLLSYANDVNFVDACTDTNLPDSSAHDLHFWMSPRRLVAQTERINQALSDMNPEFAKQYNQNAKNYISAIKNLDMKITKQLNPYRKKAIIVSHPFLGYLCHDYDISQIAVECEGKSPHAQSINRILSLARNYKAVCVFITPQHNNKGALLVAEKLNLKTYRVDPLAEDPLDTIQKVVDDITETR